MIQAIYFKTAMFDVSQEPENPINPIYGESLLRWLSSELSGQLELTEPEAEDWGWYSELSFKGQDYLVGACAYFEAGDDPSQEIEWVLQIHKHRSFKQKLLRRNKMDGKDACLLFFKALLEQNPSFTAISLGS
ncbi:hypothetical protein [Motilimonas sp. KMU-193]|uniref:hypothetical protein n=1 Tax=Motilimonas sp. KMU-193 TaxID=3388668 RepID=UPI00396B3AE9